MIRRIFYIGTTTINATALFFFIYFYSDKYFDNSPPSLLTTIMNSASAAKTPSVEYKDFVAILLTALGVMIAVLAAVLALAAVWGFAIIRDEAKKSAESIARSTAADVAKDIAESVAARTARDIRPSETSAEDAGEIAQAMDGAAQ